MSTEQKLHPEAPGRRQWGGGFGRKFSVCFSALSPHQGVLCLLFGAKYRNTYRWKHMLCQPQTHTYTQITICKMLKHHRGVA